MKRFASVAGDANFSKLPLTVSFLPLSVAMAFPSAPLTLSAVTLMPAPREFSDGTADKRALYLSPLCAAAVTATHIRLAARHTAIFRLKAMLTPPPRILAARIQRMYTAATQIVNVLYSIRRFQYDPAKAMSDDEFCCRDIRADAGNSVGRVGGHNLRKPRRIEARG